MEIPFNNSDSNSIKHPKIIVVIRHGERADLAGITVKMHILDPELTEEGKSQAYEAGLRLREILDEYSPENKKIALVSSPFSRTLVTAKYLKNGMGANLPIYTEDGLSEFISKAWFRDSPVNFLGFLTADLLLANDLMSEIIIKASLNPLPTFPESTDNCIDRFRNTLDLTVYHYLIRKEFDVLILVTHVFGIQALCEKMSIPLDVFDIEYCSTFIFKYDPSTQIYTFEKNFYPISYK